MLGGVGLESVGDARKCLKEGGGKGWNDPPCQLGEMGNVGAFEIGDCQGGGCSDQVQMPRASVWAPAGVLFMPSIALIHALNSTTMP